MNQNKLQARDFITIGIFTAILWVVQMVIMYLGFLSPFIVAGGVCGSDSRRHRHSHDALLRKN